MKAATFVVALALAGCANPGIVSVSQDVYLLSRTDRGGIFGNASAMKASVIDDANAFARQQGKVAYPFQRTRPLWSSGAHLPPLTTGSALLISIARRLRAPHRSARSARPNYKHRRSMPSEPRLSFSENRQMTPFPLPSRRTIHFQLTKSVLPSANGPTCENSASNARVLLLGRQSAPTPCKPLRCSKTGHSFRPCRPGSAISSSLCISKS